jgi:hypothetical protein
LTGFTELKCERVTAGGKTMGFMDILNDAEVEDVELVEFGSGDAFTGLAVNNSFSLLAITREVCRLFSLARVDRNVDGAIGNALDPVVDCGTGLNPFLAGLGTLGS